MDKFIDDQFVNITNDIEKIQAKPNMYISYVGNRAFLHVIKESVNNVIDEDSNPNTISDGVCDMFYDQQENMFYIRDHGRGIAFDELENACTILQSGTKMTREHGTTAGENGVGLTATNALSEIFEITSYRYGEMLSIRFREGKKVSEDVIKCKKDEHGLQLAFKPSKLYLGTDLQLPVEELLDWLEKLSFTVDSERLVFKLTVDYVGKEASTTTTFKKSDFGGFLERFCPEWNLLKTPVILRAKSTIIETDIPTKNENGELALVDISRDLSCDVVMNYNPDLIDNQEMVQFSFCNDIETVEHGQHMTAATNAILSFFRKKVKESTTKENLEVTASDITNCLAVAVSMKTDYSRGLFTSQTKHKMDNKDLYEPLRKMIMTELENYFKLPENKKTLTRIIGMIRDNIRARVAATKAKKNVSKKRKSFFETQLIVGYTAPNLIDKDPTLPFELYVIEGDSAGGNARIGRYDNDIQGTLGLTGKPSQVYEDDESFITNKCPDMKRFFDEILGCGYGSHFNLDNLIYKKIILGPDADVDGDHICSILLANIYKHAKPLIDQGYVYRVKAPLYRLRELETRSRDKSGKIQQEVIDRSNYLYDKEEYFSRYEKLVSEKFKLKFDLNDPDFVSRENLTRFLQTNRDYFEWLDTVSKQDMIHRDLIEYMAMNPKSFRETIHDAFPEMYYDKESNTIYGSHDHDFQSIFLDNIFMDKLKYLTKIIERGNDGIGYYHMFQKMKSTGELSYLGYLTIGQIMERCQPLLGTISSRFKGLGEMQPIEMAELMMNPHNRVLIKVTDKDAEETTRIMNELFNDDNRDIRKNLVNITEISRDDIDN